MHDTVDMNYECRYIPTFQGSGHEHWNKEGCRPDDYIENKMDTQPG